MKIEILEATGVKHAPYGHMKQGEIREVDPQFGAFACANGWARDVDGAVATGDRGQFDLHDPIGWQPTDKPGPPRGREKVKPNRSKLA